jgi:hypothetical protein
MKSSERPLQIKKGGRKREKRNAVLSLVAGLIIIGVLSNVF